MMQRFIVVDDGVSAGRDSPNQDPPEDVVL